MNAALFNQLLYESESTTLDFKKEQYRFAKASDEDKSEILKDILGFANAFRRSEAYILIGVEEVRGDRAKVVGISPDEHLADHALQEFVNNIVNRPIRFHYEALSYEGQHVGIIHIEEQNRPIYLKRDYGKLKKDEVYVRRGSSTNPSKPARPEEIALMGANFEASHSASLIVEFAAVSYEQQLGTQIVWEAEYCEMPNSGEIPTYEVKKKSNVIRVPIPGMEPIIVPDYSDFSSRFLKNEPNPEYYRDLCSYSFFKKAYRKIRLVVVNSGKVAANDVRIEFIIPIGHGCGACNVSGAPDPPKKNSDPYSLALMKTQKYGSMLKHAGEVNVEKNDEQFKIEIECGSLQPGRKVWTDTFYLGVADSGDFRISGHIFSANLTQPQEFSLAVNANIKRTTMTVQELLEMEEPYEEEE